MKRLVILAIILAAGISAYPQATRSARVKSSEKGSEKKEAVSRSSSKQVNRSATTKSVNAQTTRSATRQSDQKSTNRSATRQYVQKSTNSSAQKRVATPPARKSNSDRVVRSSSNESRTRATESRTVNRATNPQSKSGSVSSGSSANRSRSTDLKKSSSATRTRPNSVTTDASATRSRSIDEPGEVRVKGSGATRSFREANGALIGEDGRTIRHQNNEIFAKRKYRVDYDNYSSLRRSDEFRRIHRDYHNWYSHRAVRVIHHTRFIPVPIDVRRVRYVYRRPVHVHLVWTPTLFHRFMYYYPTHTYWDVDFGREIETISAYDAVGYVGTVRRVYGEVKEVFYSNEDNNYVLYIGQPFPYHDMSLVVPYEVMREITRNPRRYFEDRMIWSVGLINTWEGKPEMIIRDEEQIRRY